MTPMSAATARVVTSEWCEIAVFPEVLDFGSVPIASTVSRTVTVTSGGKAACTVGPLDIKGSPDFAISPSVPKPPVALAEGGSLSVSVTYTPKRMGAAAGELSVGADDPNQPVSVVSLAGSGARAAAVCSIAVDSLLLDFGKVAAGASLKLSSKVSNNGASACTVGWQLGADGSADFTLATGAQTGPLTILPGANASVSLIYKPSGAGKNRNTLQITSNDPARPTVQVSLEGSGSPAE